MEAIIDFLSKYWGYTLFGSVTVGTLIMFVITAIKFLLSNTKLKDSNTTLGKQLVSLMDVVKNKDQQLDDLKHMLVVKTKEQAQKDEYFNKVTTTTFEAISYLIMSSKLPTEDKAAIMKKFNNLTETSVEQVENASDRMGDKITTVVTSADNAAEQVAAAASDAQEKANGLITDVVGTIERSQSLLDKYSKNETNV